MEHKCQAGRLTGNIQILYSVGLVEIILFWYEDYLLNHNFVLYQWQPTANLIWYLTMLLAMARNCLDISGKGIFKLSCRLLHHEHAVYHRVLWKCHWKIGARQMDSADPAGSALAISFMGSLPTVSSLVLPCFCKRLRWQSGGSWWVDRSASTEPWHFSNWHLL